MTLATIATADPLAADMRTLVLVGTAATRKVAATAWIYTPRSAA